MWGNEIFASMDEAGLRMSRQDNNNVLVPFGNLRRIFTCVLSNAVSQRRRSTQTLSLSPSLILFLRLSEEEFMLCPS
jgi:hypothetical protein